jgi:hypothetical protein
LKVLVIEDEQVGDFDLEEVGVGVGEGKGIEGSLHIASSSVIGNDARAGNLRGFARRAT